MKGFDVYKRIDRLLSSRIGKKGSNLYRKSSKDLSLKMQKIIKPINGKILGNELSKHHVYITASNYEPAGMHHIEGALSGLPIIYKNSGALPEYCNNYGVSFNDMDFVPALKEMMIKYDFYKSNLKLL